MLKMSLPCSLYQNTNAGGDVAEKHSQTKNIPKEEKKKKAPCYQKMLIQQSESTPRKGALSPHNQWKTTEKLSSCPLKSQNAL